VVGLRNGTDSGRSWDAPLEFNPALGQTIGVRATLEGHVCDWWRDQWNLWRYSNACSAKDIVSKGSEWFTASLLTKGKTPITGTLGW